MLTQLYVKTVNKATRIFEESLTERIMLFQINFEILRSLHVARTLKD